MVNDAEKFKEEDDKQKERISAKNGLESYCFNMKTTIEDEKVKDKISDDDKKKINDKCDEAIKWLDANQLGEVDEFNEKQKEVEAVCNPIITKLYQDAVVLEVCQEECLVACQEECQVLVLDQGALALVPPLKKLTKYQAFIAIETLPVIDFCICANP